MGSKMALLKKKSEMVKLSFSVLPETANRLDKAEKRARDSGLVFDWQEHLSKHLNKMLVAVETELRAETSRQ